MLWSGGYRVIVHRPVDGRLETWPRRSGHKARYGVLANWRPAGKEDVNPEADSDPISGPERPAEGELQFSQGVSSAG